MDQRTRDRQATWRGYRAGDVADYLVRGRGWTGIDPAEVYDLLMDRDSLWGELTEGERDVLHDFTEVVARETRRIERRRR